MPSSLPPGSPASGVGAREHRESRRLAQVHRAVVEAVDGELWEAAGWRERAASLLASGEAHYDVVAALIEELRAQVREAAGGGTNER